MAYLESFILGISLAAIPGPIFFELIRRTLSKGFWSGACLAIGEFIGNFAILLLTFFGIFGFLEIKAVKIIIYLAGGLFLIWIGIMALKTNEKGIINSSKKTLSNKNSIIVGLGIALSSPLTITAWITIGGAYLSKYTTKAMALLNIFLLALGVLAFFVTLALIIYLVRKKINETYVVWMSRVFGVVLIGYGLYFMYQLVEMAL